MLLLKDYFIKIKDKLHCKFICFSSYILCTIYSHSTFAANRGDQNVGDILYNITGSFTGITKMVFGISVLAGLSFAVAAVFKFKQHKDNPAQITIGQPIGLLLLGAAMIWLPFVIRTMGTTVTGIKNKNALSKDQNVLQYQKEGSSGLGKFLIPDN